MELSQENIKEFARLKQKKYRDIHNKFIVEGSRGVSDLISSDSSDGLIEAVLYAPDFLVDSQNEKLLISAREKQGKLYRVNRKVIKKITDTVTPQSVLAVVKKWKISLESLIRRVTPNILVSVDRVSEPGNLGAILRTCDWFGVDAILLGKGTVEIWNPKVVRSSAGSIFHVPFIEDLELTNTLKTLKNRGYDIVGTGINEGVPISDQYSSSPVVLIFGNEAEGISKHVKEYLDRTIYIPSFGKADSLNVGVAVGVILYELQKSKHATRGKNDYFN